MVCHTCHDAGSYTCHPYHRLTARHRPRNANIDVDIIVLAVADDGFDRVGFTVALSFTGLDPLWNTPRATAILLTAAFALILLINSAYQDGGPEHFRAAPLRYSSVLAAVLLAPLLGLASYALLLRVQQYGWTPDRVITLACIAVTACYAVGYFGAALRSGLMLRELETTNVLSAFFIVVVLLAL